MSILYLFCMFKYIHMYTNTHTHTIFHIFYIINYILHILYVCIYTFYVCNVCVHISVETQGAVRQK